jgi:hypothetical protein
MPQNEVTTRPVAVFRHDEGNRKEPQGSEAAALNSGFPSGTKGEWGFSEPDGCLLKELAS